MRRFLRNPASSGFIFAALVTGCGGPPSVDSSTTEATVTGMVLIKGKPATGGEIQFDPSNSERAVGSRSAPIGKDGSYSIKTYTGTNRISFTGTLAAENPGLFRAKLFHEVERGENKKDFDLLNDSEPAKGVAKSYGKPKR